MIFYRHPEMERCIGFRQILHLILFRVCHAGYDRETGRLLSSSGKLEFFSIMIKKVGQRKKYDCIVGVFRGMDLSYLLVKLKEWGLRSLTVHYDNM